MANPLGGVPAAGVSQLQASGAVAAGAAGQTGKMASGQLVQASNKSSPLAQSSDIAEEIGSARANFRTKDEIKTTKGKTESERQLELIEKIKVVEEIHGVEDFKRSFPEDSKEKFESDDYLKEAKNQFNDPYHQYLALYELAVDLKAKPEAEVFQAIKTLENEHPKYIEIGKEISRAAGKLAEKYPDSSYSEINKQVYGHVKDHKSLADAFKNLNRTQGTDNNNQMATGFEKSVDIRLKLLSGELNSMTATTEDAHLRSVINDMTALKRLVGIYDSCMETQGEMSRPPTNFQQFNGQQYMTEILDLLDKQFVTGNDFTMLMNNMGLGEQSVQVKTAFINKTAALMRDIPEEIFSNQQIKDSLVSAIQEEQDSLALEEEGGGKADENYGKGGETEVSEDTLNNFLNSNPVSNTILEDLGRDFQGGQDSPVPGFMESPAVPTLGSGTEAAQPEPIADPAKSTADPAKGTPPKVTAKGKTGATPEVTSKDSFDGLSDQELLEKQDELLIKARELQQSKDTNFVYKCSVTALNHAKESGDGDIIKALQKVTSARGKSFAKGLKVGITPAGEGKELQLIPPDTKALKEWEKTHPGESVTDLVRTAMEVLKDNRGDDFDSDKINKEIDSLKQTIQQLDSKIKKRPERTVREIFKISSPEESFTSRLKNSVTDPKLRLTGVELFERLEDSHRFSIKAEEKSLSVEATWDEPGSPDASDDMLVEATMDEAASEDSDEGMTVEATFGASGEGGGSFGEGGDTSGDADVSGNASAEPAPARGTAAFIAAKVQGQVEGESYGDVGDILKDIQSLAGDKAQLKQLLNYIAQADASQNKMLLDGNEEKIKKYIQSLVDLKGPPRMNPRRNEPPVGEMKS